MPVPALPVGAPSLGADFKLPALDGPAAPSDGKGFGQMLADQIGHLNEMQKSADAASQALATGQATDVSSVVMEVERASLALQLATQVRNKAVDAYHDIFRMQV